MANMRAEKAGNSLLQLPQEIRNKIYNHYFNQSYTVFWSVPDVADNEPTCSTTYGRNSSEEEAEKQKLEPQSLFRDLTDSDWRAPADFAILRTCKRINSDAENILYSEATTFIYRMRFDYRTLNTTPPAREATDRMTNVEFGVRIGCDIPTSQSLYQRTHDHEQHQLYSRMEATCGATLDRFAGTSVIRDSFRITFEIGFVMYNNSISRLIESPFFQTLKKFIGFRRVVVKLNSAVLAHYATDIEARETVRKVQKALELHLGPSIGRVGNTTIDRLFGFLKYFSVEIEFEPRKFHIKKLRARI